MVRAMAIEIVVRATCIRRAYSVRVWRFQTGSVAVPVDMPHFTKRLRNFIVLSSAYPLVSKEKGTNEPTGMSKCLP